MHERIDAQLEAELEQQVARALDDDSRHVPRLRQLASDGRLEDQLQIETAVGAGSYLEVPSQPIHLEAAQRALVPAAHTRHRSIRALNACKEEEACTAWMHAKRRRHALCEEACTV